MQRLADANRKAEALEAQYQPPENDSRFPNIVMSAQASDPNSSAAAAAVAAAGGPNGRAPAPGAWNPAALPQAQQQQLLITAAQRQNIPLHEIKNLTPASRNGPDQLDESAQPGQRASRPSRHEQSAHGTAASGPPPTAAGASSDDAAATPGRRTAAHASTRWARRCRADARRHAGATARGPPSNAGAAGSPAPPTPGGPMDGRRSVAPVARASVPTTWPVPRLAWRAPIPNPSSTSSSPARRRAARSSHRHSSLAVRPSQARCPANSSSSSSSSSIRNSTRTSSRWS